ncbi:DNA polymerase epsilon subunit 3 [Plakobranchus ocellatus]|uniref:DNA polymerase epsilon subunit 3 n=1 Tax=Plakobranchus ocellatus TaxID=259542 RepID=A0AAV3XX78_9GAST|nr:DNA polymerase epsilon subunit 3 [Plakobranchus ocellatus]
MEDMEFEQFVEPLQQCQEEGVNVSKEARLAISKAASVFVLYATSCSNNFALKGKRKTIGAQDVLNAMEDMEFEQFVEPLQQCQEAFRQEKMEKKKEKQSKPAPTAQADPGDKDVEELSDGEGESAQVKESGDSKLEDTNDSGFIVTTNQEDDSGSDSSVEMIEYGGD